MWTAPSPGRPRAHTAVCFLPKLFLEIDRDCFLFVLRNPLLNLFCHLTFKKIDGQLF